MKMKKSLSFILIIMLILSSSFSMATPNKADPIDIIVDPEIANGENVDLVLDKDIYDENEKVRVVVQLEEEPALFKMQRSTKKYANLSESSKASLEKAVINSQSTLQKQMKEKGVGLEVINSMTVGVNAFSSIVKRGDIEEISKDPKVKGVYISNEYHRPEEPEMLTSHDLIGSTHVWNTFGYKGQNMVVAIVDTGIDPSHKDMKLSEGVPFKIDKKTVENFGLPGTFRTNKVPYGYNYFDRNQIILNTTINSHGMHVAGTVGANGQIKGVAPEAQLLAMKVFSNDPDFPSTYDDIYMKAIDDAIKLGVDVVNMSLGSTASFYSPNSAIDEMITNARQHGVVFSISAGNSAYSNDGYGNNLPIIGNPDIGLVGSPSLNKDSISVASMENTHSQVNYIAYGEGKKAPYALAGSIELAGRFDGPVEFLDAAFGNPADFEGKDFTGKIALISRGSIAFTEKIENAEKAGALAAIIYNNAGNDLINMAYPDKGKIPAAFIGNTYGVELKALDEKLMSFPRERMAAVNPNSGLMSAFTSWGTTPSLEMKPEITAPGGQIYSTLEADTYGMMSGTSMAAPHLSGGSALVLQYIRDQFPNMQVGNVSEFAKKLLMNTADPIRDTYGEFYSPRRQGAGLMDLTSAITSPVTLVNKADGEPKLALKEIKSKKFDMKLVATNHSNKSASYDIEVDVLSQYIHGQGFSFIDVEPMPGVIITGDTSIALEPGQSKEISLGVDLSQALMPGTNVALMDNVFIEGFVRLIAPVETTEDGIEEEVYPSLVLPYVGFYGDWFGENSPRIIDGMVRFGQKAFYGTTAGIVNQNASYMGYSPFLGYTDSIDRLAINPRSEDPEVNQQIVPVISLLRNAEEIQFNVLDESGNQIKRIRTESWVRKQYSNSQGTWYSYIPARGWDGMLNNEVAPDGKYFYEIRAKVQGGQWQINRYPVYVDSKAPEILDFQYEDGKLTWKASDEGIGISYFSVTIGEEEPILVEPNLTGQYQLEVESPQGKLITLIAEDYAGNQSQAEINLAVGEKPTMDFNNPEPFQLYNQNKINIKGNVKSELGLKSLIAYLVPDEDQAAKLEVKIDVDEDGNFDHLVENLQDAVYTIRLVATDVAGQTYEIFRYFYVDTTAPVIKSLDVKIEDVDGTGIDKKMPAKGMTIVIPEINEAYHRDYLAKNSMAMNKFKEAQAQNKAIYVKLAHNIFVGNNGQVVGQESIPALKYYDSQGLVENYDKDGKYVSIKERKASFTIEVEENHGYFEVYVNGSQEYIQSESGVIERKAFAGTIKFQMVLKEAIKDFEVKIVDQAGNQTIKKVSKD